MSNTSVSTIIDANGFGMSKHGRDLSLSLTCLTIFVCSSVQGTGFFQVFCTEVHTIIVNLEANRKYNCDTQEIFTIFSYL